MKNGTMKIFRGASVGVVSLVLLFAAGCKNADQKAIDQAKAQAAATGTAQQVQYVDNNGNTVTSVVQPPAAQGQAPQVTTTTTPPAPGTKVAATQPTITPMGATSTQAMVDANGQPIAPAANAPTSPAANGAPSGPAPALQLTVPAGTELAIRVNESINVKHAHAGDHFDGEVVAPVTMNGNVVIPRGTPVAGRIDAAHRRGHFKGRSLLELRLTSMTLNGYQYALDTHDNVMSKKGKGKRTAGFIGGLTTAGMVIGGVASGGVGLAVGAAAGAGTGTLLAGTTGNRDIDIPAESVVHFRLSDDLVVQNQ